MDLRAIPCLISLIEAISVSFLSPSFFSLSLFLSLFYLLYFYFPILFLLFTPLPPSLHQTCFFVLYFYGKYPYLFSLNHSILIAFLHLVPFRHCLIVTTVKSPHVILLLLHSVTISLSLFLFSFIPSYPLKGVAPLIIISHCSIISSRTRTMFFCYEISINGTFLHLQFFHDVEMYR